jgi:Trk K+ transport system NAD-binding subunit
MKLRRRRLYGYVAAFAGVILLYALLYSWAMAFFEGQARTFGESLLVVVETFTTTGYGEDAGNWNSPWTIALMTVMQFTGVIFIFMALPLFVVPWMEQRLSTTPPAAIDGFEDHVVVCSYTTRSELLVEELDLMDVDYVIVESDRERAVDLVEDDRPTIHGDPEETKTLENACIADARAVVADVDDESNASISLAVAEVCDDGNGPRVITFVEDDRMAAYHRYAGADDVLQPRQLIGQSLASKVTTSVTAEVGDAVEIGEDFEILELPVQAGSDLAGKRVAHSGIRERTGANIIGAWFRGEFVSPPDPDDVIDERTVLLVAGHQHQLEQLKELSMTEGRIRQRGPVLVCGYGEVGTTVADAVRSQQLSCRTIDVEDAEGVDVVGDVTRPSTFESTDIENVSTVVLALSDDTAAVFATLVLRELDADVEIVARANDTDSVQRLYRAGADYVLALATVSGRMLASTVLDEDVISYDKGVEVVRMGVGRLAGHTLGAANVRDRTGCTVIAIERNGSVITDIDAAVRFEEGDDVVVAGPDDGVAEFSSLVG